MRGIIAFLIILLSVRPGYAQECASFSKDSVQVTKQLNDLFFSPSGYRGIAIGNYSYDLLLKKDSVYWEKVTNNFGTWADANMKAGLFINEDFAVAVDAGGYIHTIVDMGDGISWGRKKFWDLPLYDIDFYEDSLGMAVGLGGCVLRAIDFNGEDFDTIPAFTTNDLYAVDIVNESTVFIAGNNIIWKSTDFGENWIESIPAEGMKFIDIKFFNPSDGITISEGGYMYATSDGGENWKEVSKFPHYLHLKSIAIYNENIVFASGGMNVLISYNKGYNWYEIPGLNELGRTYNAICIKDSETAYLAENNGTITEYKIGDNLPPTEISLSDTSFYETGLDGLWVANINVSDPDGNFESTVVESGLGFFIESNSLKNTYGFYYSSAEQFNNYKITLAAIDDCGFEFHKEFNISVLPYGPTDLTLSKSYVKENQSVGHFVGKLTTVAHVQSSYTYALVAGSNDVDNNSFSISNDSLFAKEVFHVGTHNSRQIRIRTMDDRGNTFEKALFLTVVDETTALDPNISKNKSIIYPNPVVNSISFEGKQFKSYEIIDVSGNVKMTGRIESNSLDVQYLQNGIYILKLIDSYDNIEKFLFLKE